MTVKRSAITICGVGMMAAAVWGLPAQASTKASTSQCSADALAQAPKLLAFHFGQADDRIHIEPAAKALPSIVNPVNRKQRFDVLEVWGTIYKGRYRMRFEYYRSSDGKCMLMGQEILEYASL